MQVCRAPGSAHSAARSSIATARLASRDSGRVKAESGAGTPAMDRGGWNLQVSERRFLFLVDGCVFSSSSPLDALAHSVLDGIG